VEPLLALLPDADLRGFALQALSVIGDRRSNTAMLAMLQDENVTVRAHAVLALLNSEDPGGVGKALEAIPALEVDINAQITETVQRAGPQLADGLLVALNGDEQTRKMAFTMLIVMALDQHGEPLPAMPFGLGTAVEPLLRFADDPVDPVRVNAFTLLALAREPRALPVFRNALAAPDAKKRGPLRPFSYRRAGGGGAAGVRAAAGEGSHHALDGAACAGAIGGAAPPADPERRRAADLLLPMLQEPNLSVRSLTINRLGLTGDPRALNALLPVARLRNSDLACMAIRVLGQFTDPRATEALCHALRVNRGRELMLNALASALADSADPQAHEALLTVIDDPALPSEENALNALIPAGHPRIVEQIITWLSPEYDAGDNRLGADDYVGLITALGKTGDPSAVEPLVAQLTAQELRRRPAAARSLGRLQDPRAVPALIAALQDPSRTFEDSDEDVATRRDAALALGDIGDARAVEPLIAMLEIGDMDARGAAAQSLGRLKDARAVAPLIQALDRLSGSAYRAACTSLQQLTGHDFGDDAARWQAWTAEHAPL